MGARPALSPPSRTWRPWPCARAAQFIMIQIDGLAHEYLLRAMAAATRPTSAGSSRRATGSRDGAAACPPPLRPANRASCTATTGTCPRFAGTRRSRASRRTASRPPTQHASRPRCRRGGRASFGAARAMATSSTATRTGPSHCPPWAGSASTSTCAGWAGPALAPSPGASSVSSHYHLGTGARHRAHRGGVDPQRLPAPRLTLIKPVLQVLTNVFLPEIQTFGVLLDVYRGMPSVYVNYYGYDEVAHGDGALGPGGGARCAVSTGTSARSSACAAPTGPTRTSTCCRITG